MALWRSEVSIDGVSLAVPGSAAFPLFQPGYAGGSYALTATDVDLSATPIQLYVKVNQIHDREVNGPTGLNVYFTRMTAGLFAGVLGHPFPDPDPYDGTIFDSSGEFANDTYDGGVLFRGGGVLAIEKDTATGRVSFISPAGRWDTDTATIGIALTTPIRPLSIGLLLQAQDIPPDGSAPGTFSPHQSLDVKFSHLAGKKDGVTVTGAAMSSGNPGIWSAWTESALFTASFDFSATQEATDDKGSIDFPGNGAPNVGSTDEGIYRQWEGPDVFPAGKGIDMEKSVEHGVMYRAYPDWSLPSQMDFERSFNNGHTWSAPVVVAGDGAWMNASPSLNSVDGRLYLCWHNGTNILEARSLDGGANWSMPVTIPFTGTNPRRIADKHGGGSYYFFVDGSGNIKVAVTYDNGASFRGPYTVVTGVGAQQIDAEFAPDSSIVVSYLTGGVWTQRRSRDLGQTWL